MTREEHPAFERSSGNVYAYLYIPDAERMQAKARLAELRTLLL